MNDAPRHRGEPQRYEEASPEQLRRLTSGDTREALAVVFGVLVGVYWGVGAALDPGSSTRLRILGWLAVFWAVVAWASYVLRFTKPLRALWWTRGPTRRLVRLLLLRHAWWSPLAIGGCVYVVSRLRA